MSALSILRPPLPGGERRGDLLQALLDQGTSPEAVLGADAAGVPMVCGTSTAPGAPIPPAGQGGAVALPPGTRGWECVPGVILADGVDSFRVEVDTNGPVIGVTLELFPQFAPASGSTIRLRDDGLEGDRQPSDHVFTSELLRYNTEWPVPPTYGHSPHSPAGIDTPTVGIVRTEEMDGSTFGFLVPPAVGILRPDLPISPPVLLASDLSITPHVINLRTDANAAQKALRFVSSEVPDMTRRIYQILPDAMDLVVLFSTGKIEWHPGRSSNFNSGVHLRVQTNFTGSGQEPFDSSASYGSKGRLLSCNVIDAYSRGIHSQNVTHEIVHQWAAYLRTDFGLSDGTGHYSGRSSAGSLVGGQVWIENPDGTLTLNCEEGRNAAHHASSIDRYLMGLLPPESVKPLHVYSESSPGPLRRCGQVVDDIVRTITIDDLIAAHGPRTPGPETAQRDFRIAFVAESRGRLLNAVEMTFYEILAAHYTKPVPPTDPAPYLETGGWVPVTRFFGEGTTWSSEVVRQTFIRGDGNRDGGVDLSDAVFTLLYLFGPLPGARCLDALDANDDADVNLSDVVFLLIGQFGEGPLPAAPFPQAGPDPTGDGLGCDDR